ncbi:S1 family peptidase, partial [Streptomyces sp. SID8499]|nr:S1 family peptidase [Streptomyces sp. SID8499]
MLQRHSRAALAAAVATGALVLTGLSGTANAGTAPGAAAATATAPAQSRAA